MRMTAAAHTKQVSNRGSESLQQKHVHQEASYVRRIHPYLYIEGVGYPLEFCIELWMIYQILLEGFNHTVTGSSGLPCK